MGMTNVVCNHRMVTKVADKIHQRTFMLLRVAFSQVFTICGFRGYLAGCLGAISLYYQNDWCLIQKG